jgi:hypothetical protein
VAWIVVGTIVENGSFSDAAALAFVVVAALLADR